MEAKKNNAKSSANVPTAAYVNAGVMAGTLKDMNLNDNETRLQVTVVTSSDNGEHKQTLTAYFFGENIKKVQEILKPASVGSELELHYTLANSKFKDKWQLQILGESVKLH